MKNLQNFGVQELNAREIRETEGGWWLFVVAAALIVGLVVGLSDKKDSCPE